MALEVLSAEELRSLLLEIGTAYSVIRDIGPHRGVISRIDMVLAKIATASSQSLPQSIYDRLDQYEEELKQMKIDAQKCVCESCRKAA